jgi:uncharacterized protein
MNKSKNVVYTHPNTKQHQVKELTLFVLLAITVSWPIMIIVINRIPPNFQTGNIQAVEDLFGNLPFFFGMGPLIAAVIITMIYRGASGIKELFMKAIKWRVSFSWYIAALILPVISQWAGLFLWQAFTNTSITLPSFSNHLSSWIQISLISTIYYITEELGWRGFMLPRLLSMNSWMKASIIVGIIWSLWHYPLWLTSAWATSGSWLDAFQMVAANTIFATGASFLLTAIFRKTESVLLAMIFHGSSQANLTKMYHAAGETSLLGPSFSIVQAITMSVAVIALIVIVNRKKVFLSTAK